MGSGKTTIGQCLASHLKREFIDSDAIIAERAGMEISAIFDNEGESGFRQRENQILTELTRKQDIVLATGGGAVLNKDIRSLLKTHGLVIFLQPSIETQLTHLHQDPTTRPLLQNLDTRQTELETLNAQRLPLYQETADITISLNNETPEQVIDTIMQSIDSANT